MKLLKSTAAFSFVLCLSVYAIQTSTESVNPFSKYSVSNAGVNEYTGAAMTSLPLGSISGVNVGLNYSSNVTVNARSDNGAAPASWCGLGWQLGFGSILSNHKNTAISDDDDYIWISPEGVPNEIVKPYHLKYSFYNNYPQDAPDIPTIEPNKTGATDDFCVTLIHDVCLDFLYVFEGDINLPYDGIYTFYTQNMTEADNCKSLIFINDTLIVSTDRKKIEASGQKNLSKGEKRIKVIFRYHDTGPFCASFYDYSLKIKFSHENISKRSIPTTMLFHPDANTDGKRNYYVKSNPLVKFAPQDLNADGIFDGWIVTYPDGNKYKYGNLNYDDQRNANRYVFKCNEYVGSITAGIPSLYPYQWDLSAIQDISGNEVKFFYQQEKEYVTSGTFSSKAIDTNLRYTKASYPARIENKIGEKIVFTLENKPDNEPYDPYNYLPEPDGFMEMYNSKRLAKVDHYLPKVDIPLKTFKFGYNSLNSSMSFKFQKSILTQVREYNCGDDDEHLLSSINYSYYDDESKAIDYNSNYNYGALKSIVSSNGTKTTYNYKLKTEANTGIYDEVSTSPSIPSSSNGFSVFGGIYDENKEYILAVGDHQDCHDDRIFLYCFDGHEWKLDDVINDKSISFHPDIFTYDNTFIIMDHDQTDSISVYYWNKKKWICDIIYVKTEFGPEYTVDWVYVGNDFIVFRGGDGGDDYNDQIWLMRRVDNQWVLDEKYKGYRFFSSDGVPDTREKQVLTGKDFFVVKPSGGHDESWLVYWDGKQWHETFPKCIQNNNYYEIYTGSNYVVWVGGSGNNTVKDYIWVYYWNGKEWTFSKNFGGSSGRQIESGSTCDKKIIPGNGYFLVLKNANTTWENWVVTFDGNDWNTTKLEPVPTNNDGLKIKNAFAGPDYFIIYGGNPDIYDDIRIYNKTNNGWVKDSDFDWDKITWPNENTDNLTFVTGKNCFALSTVGSIEGGMKKIFNQIYSFDGSKWKVAYTHFGDNKWKQDHTTGVRISQCGLPYGFGFTINEFANTQASPCDTTNFLFVHKFQDNFDSVRTYTVDSKVVNSYPQSNDMSTFYNYSDSYFDSYAGIFRFNKVETVNNPIGKTINYYYNNSTADNQQNNNTDYKKLDGLIYRTEVFNKDNIISNEKVVSSSNIQYQIFRRLHWPEDAYLKRVKKTLKSTYGVINQTENIAFNDVNGLPSVTQEKNGDGSIKETRVKFAFEDTFYKNEFGFNNKCMLTQPCQTAVFGSTGTGTVMRPLAATAVTYKKDSNLNCWLPFENYTLKVNKEDDGFPASDFNFQDFNHTPGANNPNWKYSGGTTLYSPMGVVKQTTDAGHINTSTIRRSDNLLTISQIPSAKFLECGVFTGDYDLNDDGSYFDKENGWRKGAGNERGLPGPVSVVSEEAKHFGNKGVKVTNAFGPSRAFKLEQGRDYIFSAWIKKVSGDVPLQNGMVIGVDYRKCKSAAGVWPFELYLATESPTISCNSNLDTVQHGDWYYIELSVNASKDIPITKWNEGYQYASAWVGVPNGNGNNGTATVYIDDIRFYPKSALVTSTYYDKFFGQPIISIDANNNPSKRITYDGFGRPVKWEKLDLSKGTGESGYTTTVMTKEYNFLDDCLSRQHINLYHPNGAETFIPGQGIPISWAMLEQGTVTIAYKKEGDAVYTALYTQSYNPGQNNYTWSIPGELGGDYKIKVTNTRSDGTTCSDESDATFRINGVAIQSPLSTAKWIAGTKRQVKWLFTGPASVDVYYSNGTTRVLLASNIGNTGGNGTYEWKIPPDYNTERNSKIVITNHENSEQLIESQVFTILKRSTFIKKWFVGSFW